MAGRSGARPRPPATTTTSLPRSSSSGHPRPNGPRTPSAAPAGIRVSASLTGPTARTVCVTRAPATALTEIGISPCPYAHSMLNWPGAHDMAASSMSRLTVSCVSRRRASTRWTRGGAKGASARVSADGNVTIDIQQLQLRQLEVADRDIGETAHQVVAELVVRLAFPTQALAIQADDAGWLHRDGVEVPPVGLEEPRPADGVALAPGGDDERLASRGCDLDRDTAVADDVERRRRLPDVDDVLAGFEVVEAAAPGDLLEHIVRQPGKNVRLGDQLPDGAHGVPPTASAVNACASAVMSMATGHHAMHRPHPVQP